MLKTRRHIVLIRWCRAAVGRYGAWTVHVFRFIGVRYEYIRLFLSMMRTPPRATLFPYTTLFRSMRMWQRRSSRDFWSRLNEGRENGQPWDLWEIGRATRLNSSHRCITNAVFCLKKKKKEEKREPVTVFIREQSNHATRHTQFESSRYRMMQTHKSH